MSTRRISIITAAYVPLAQYFAEAIDSVLSQEPPHPWELEWLVQEDGTDPRLADLIAGLPGVSYAANGYTPGLP